jgi:hypothetical protein
LTLRGSLANTESFKNLSVNVGCFSWVILTAWAVFQAPFAVCAFRQALFWIAA